MGAYGRGNDWLPGLCHGLEVVSNHLRHGSVAFGDRSDRFAVREKEETRYLPRDPL